MIIRDEAAGDETAIGTVTAAAFADMPYSNQTEPRIIERLQRTGATTVSLVAEDGGEILGHIAFSRVTLAGGKAGWYGLGPVSVRPDRQKRGIGFSACPTTESGGHFTGIFTGLALAWTGTLRHCRLPSGILRRRNIDASER